VQKDEAEILAREDTFNSTKNEMPWPQGPGN